MKDNNKKIFLGVIVVATLIIAIIGATFAFFSASGGSANNAITANATTLANLGFTSSHSKIATNLVPVSSESSYFSRYPGIAASGEHSCLDDVGNQICSIYEFTVTNTASVAQTIYVSFVPSENTFDNMYFAAFNTSIASANYVVATGSTGTGNSFSLIPQTTVGNSTLGHVATKLTKNSTSPIDMPGLSKSLGVGESVTYTILIWLQETGVTQNTEQGGTFKAGVNVTTGGNSTGVTGIMGENVSGDYVYSVSSSSAFVGQAIPNDLITYPTVALAFAGWKTEYYYYEDVNDEEPLCLEHRVNDNIIEESNVVFSITPAMASMASGVNVGTYTLKASDDGTYYDDNINIIKSAFGENSEYCYSYNYNGGINYACELYFNGYFGLSVYNLYNGGVGVSYDFCGNGCNTECRATHYGDNGQLYSWCGIQ